MQKFRKSIHRFTRRLFGSGIVHLCRKIRRTQRFAQKARLLADQHQHIQALKLGESIINDWYPAESMLEKQVRRFLLFSLLKRVKKQLIDWEMQAKVTYEAAVQLVHQLIATGQFRNALMCFEPVYRDFYVCET